MRSPPVGTEPDYELQDWAPLPSPDEPAHGTAQVLAIVKHCPREA